MRNFILILICIVLLLAGCGGKDGLSTKVNREKLDGVECIVVRNSHSDFIRAIDCNWENIDE